MQWTVTGVPGSNGVAVQLLAEGEGEEHGRENATTPLHQTGEGPVGDKAHPRRLATPGLVECSVTYPWTLQSWLTARGVYHGEISGS